VSEHLTGKVVTGLNWIGESERHPTNIPQRYQWRYSYPKRYQWPSQVVTHCILVLLLQVAPLSLSISWPVGHAIHYFGVQNAEVEDQWRANLIQYLQSITQEVVLWIHIHPEEGKGQDHDVWQAHSSWWILQLQGLNERNNVEVRTQSAFNNREILSERGSFARKQKNTVNNGVVFLRTERRPGNCPQVNSASLHTGTYAKHHKGMQNRREE